MKTPNEVMVRNFDYQIGAIKTTIAMTKNDVRRGGLPSWQADKIIEALVWDIQTIELRKAVYLPKPFVPSYADRTTDTPSK